MGNKKQKKERKKSTFWADFKKFITRGNVLDMAVGVIVGSAFTAIINALSNNILKPLINFILARILGENSLSEVYTFLKRVDLADGSGMPDLTQSIYIDWGAFINAIINFLLIALTLFTIVRIITRVRAKLDAKELAEKARLEAEAKAKADAEAQAKAEADAAAAEAAAAKLAEEEAAKQRFYENVERQTALLEELAKNLKK